MPPTYAVELQACAAAASDKIVMLEEAGDAATLTHEQDAAAALSQLQAAQVGLGLGSRFKSGDCMKVSCVPTLHHGFISLGHGWFDTRS